MASKLLKWHHLTGSGEIVRKTKENQAVDGHGLMHAEKVPDVAFWRPKERWRKANATAWHHLTGSVEIEILGPQGAPFNMRPKQGNPSRIQNPSKKCLTLLSDALKKDEERPTQLPDITWQAASKSKFWGPKGHRSTCIRNRETPAGFKPNQPKPSVEKVPDVAFWRPLRWI